MPGITAIQIPAIATVQSTLWSILRRAWFRQRLATCREVKSKR